jgi:RNA ligase (TIGR02306 family)
MDTLTRTTRALATVETIASLRDIPDADSIVVARIRDWSVVVRRDEFQVGDKVVYFEIDSLLNVDDPRFSFLAPRGVRTTDEGRSGHVLKTARLRGQYSQGLVIALSEFPEIDDAVVGEDVTEALGVIKWDPPLPSEVEGQAIGFLPSWIHSTAEERVQNFAGLLASGDDGNWVATEKLDGSSTSVWVDGDAYGVASRTMDLLENPEAKMWGAALRLGIHDALRDAYPGRPAAAQGETYGAGVLGKNPLNLKEVRFAVFTLQVDGQLVPRSEWPQFFLDLAVPVYEGLPFPATVDDALAQVDGLKSLISPDRSAEGIVWRNSVHATLEVNGQVVRASAKVISPKYAMKFDS